MSTETQKDVYSTSIDTLFNGCYSVVNNLNWKLVTAGIIATGAGIFMAKRVHIASPGEILAKTGFFMRKEIHICKNTIRFPYQKVSRINLNSTTYPFTMKFSSKEGLEFDLPIVCLVSPKNTIEGLLKFTRCIEDAERISTVISPVFESRIRNEMCSRTIEDLIKERETVQNKIFVDMATDMDKFGLSLEVLLLKDPLDTPTSNYLKEKKKRISEAESHRDQLEEAEKRIRGDLGVKQTNAEIKVRTVMLQTEADQKENEQRMLVEDSKAALQAKMIGNEKRMSMLKNEAQAEIERQQLALQRDLEESRLKTEEFKIRAEKRPESIILAECRKEESDALLYEESNKLKTQKEASESNAKEITNEYQALAEGIQHIVKAFGGNHELALKYILSKEVYPKMAEHTAEALKGLKPNINIWQNEGSSKDENRAMQQVHQFMPFLRYSVESQLDSVAKDKILDQNNCINVTK